MESIKPMTIVQLKINNILRIRAFSLNTTSSVVTLSGANGAGKSSVLNAIDMAFRGAAAIPPNPVRKGEAHGTIVCNLDDIEIERNFSSSSGPHLVVRSKGGALVRSPQTLLNTLWSSMCDPVRFVRLSDTPEGCRKQAEILRQIVNLDFTALDTERKSLYEEREELGRELKNHKGQLSGLTFHADAPEKESSSADLMAALEKAQSHNSDIDKKAQEVRDFENAITQDRDRITELEKEIVGLEQQIKNKRTLLEAREANIVTSDQQMNVLRQQVLDSVKADTSTITKQMSDADGINRKVRENASRREVETKVRTTQERYDILTNQIDEIDEEKRDKLAKAPFPVPGLAFSETGIMLDGVPFSQGSQAEQLVAATAIALALKPRIRVVLLRDASLLDTKTRLAVAELAHREQAQVFEEVVESDDESAIVIEDGQVKEKP